MKLLKFFKNKKSSLHQGAGYFLDLSGGRTSKNNHNKLGDIKPNWSNKKGIELDMLGWFIIAIVILIIVVIVIIVWKGKMINAINYITDLFRFRK